MKLKRTPEPRRGGFTLIELLVVIAIIAILVALTATAVIRVLRKGPEITARHDISQLSTAIQSFKTDFKVDYLPSRIRLREDLAYNLNDPYEADSLQYLKRLWPRLGGGTPPPQFIDWDGNGVFAGAGSFIDLEGDQCLVFFLGGIPTYGPAGVSGFSTNPFDPSQPNTTGSPRKVPYFEGFQATRLVQRSAAAGNNFYSFMDAWNQQPYAYFSSYKGQNGYFRYAGTNIPGNTGSDCSGLGVSPYAELLPPGSLRCYNPDGFQIISAGLDGAFGRGSLPAWSSGDTTPYATTPIWTPQLAGATTATWQIKTAPGWTKTAGNDDMTNFYDSALGASR